MVSLKCTDLLSLASPDSSISTSGLSHQACGGFDRIVSVSVLNIAASLPFANVIVPVSSTIRIASGSVSSTVSIRFLR